MLIIYLFLHVNVNNLLLESNMNWYICYIVTSAKKYKQEIANFLVQQSVSDRDFYKQDWPKFTLNSDWNSTLIAYYIYYLVARNSIKLVWGLGNYAFYPIFKLLVLTHSNHLCFRHLLVFLHITILYFQSVTVFMISNPILFFK